MKALLTFSKEELERLVMDKASQGGFVVTSDVEWDVERDEVSVGVRPMSPEERIEFDLQNRPFEEILLGRLREVVEDLVGVVRKEHEDTRDTVDQSVMEWLEPFRSQTGKIMQIVSDLQRGGPARIAKPGNAAALHKEDLEEENADNRETLQFKSSVEDDEDEAVAARRARYARVRQEMEAENHVERVTIKGESPEFPADKRIT